MQEVASSGELAFLAAERVWQETVRALAEDQPWHYFRELHRAGALSALMPELSALYDSEKSTAVKALELAAQRQAAAEVRFAVALCPAGQAAEKSLKSLCERLKVPGRYRELAVQSARLLPAWQQPWPLSAESRLALLCAGDALRRPQRFQAIVSACAILAEVNGYDSPDRVGAQLLLDQQQCQAVDVAALVEGGLSGRALGAAIHRARLLCLAGQEAVRE